MATATLTGRNGERPRAWIAGTAAGFSRQYEFPAGRPLVIDEVDAAALRAGTIDTGGRVFAVSAAPAKAAESDIGDGPPAPRKGTGYP
jgi:hypothetical protein